MQWIVLAVGLIGCSVFCWYVLREDRRSMRAHHARRERMRLVPDHEVAVRHEGAGAGERDDEPARDAA